MRLRNPLNHMARQSLRVMHAMAMLQADGCRILDSHAHTTPPVIRVDRRPSLIQSFGFVSPPPGKVRVPVLCAGHRWGLRIEWINRESNQ